MMGNNGNLKPIFKKGDKVSYHTMIGKVVKVEYSKSLGWCYLVKYGLFRRLWAMEISLKKVGK